MNTGWPGLVRVLFVIYSARGVQPVTGASIKQDTGDCQSSPEKPEVGSTSATRSRSLLLLPALLLFVMTGCSSGNGDALTEESFVNLLKVEDI